jgi:hypothetical protein
MNVGELKKFLNRYDDNLIVTTNRRDLSETSEEVNIIFQATGLVARNNRLKEEDQLVIVTNIGRGIY